MSALLLALLLGILPMAVAAISGKPMQGSIGWGMNILTGKSSTKKDGILSDNKVATSA